MYHDSSSRDGSTGSFARRAVTKAVSLSTFAALAGCLGGGSDAGPTSEPVDLSGGKEDDQGGMVIDLRVGPDGQVFYRDSAPEGHDNPVWSHTPSMGLFPYYFEHRERGWEAAAVYVTGYSTVGYELSTEGGDMFIPTLTDTDTFGDAIEMTCVVESEVLGGMGKDLIPLSSESDVDGSIAEHGGKTVVFDDVTPEWLRGYMRP